MTIRIEKPAFNLRSKLNDLDFGQVPLQKMPTGSVIQTIYNLKTDSFTTTNTNRTSDPRGVEVTGSATAITPRSAGNKILVRATFGMTNSNTNYYAHAFLYRGSTLIGTSVATGKGGGHGIHSQSIERLDSPNTTSTTTYTIRLAAEGNTAKIGRAATASSDSDLHDDLSIVIMEIQQ
tara:strand:- start:628 stop:1161 length:534 start_codon:yes stop_codon:yes gene_type:complete